MGQQLDLGDACLHADIPRARRSDPSTSHAAAERMIRTGTAKAHQHKILIAVRQYPGSTYVELAAITGLERHAVGRRLAEIETGGYIRRGHPVTRGGRPMLAWYPV